LKKAGDVEGLRALLDPGNEDDPRRRAEAARALAGLEGETADAALAQALADPDPDVRAAALDAAVDRETPAAAELVLDAVAAWPYPADYALLERAVVALVRWGPARAAEGLGRRLLSPGVEDLDERHRDALLALVAADDRGEEEAAEAVAHEVLAELREDASETAVARAEQIFMWLGAPAAGAVVAALDRDAAAVAPVRIAGLLRDSRAVDPLVGRLASGSAEMRAAAATALGRVNDTRAVQALIGATQDPEHVVRDAASSALDGMGVAAVIVGVSSVMRETIRDQLGAGDGAADALPERSPEPSAAGLPAPGAAEPPPRWAQEVLGRLLRRSGGAS
jgi:HEAT repeat protein